MTATPDDQDRAEAPSPTPEDYQMAYRLVRQYPSAWSLLPDQEKAIATALATARRDERERCAGICDEARKAALRTQHASMSPELAQRAATEADAAKQLATAIRQPGKEQS